METLDSYKVNLRDAYVGLSSYAWHVGDAVFSALQGTEFTSGSLDVELEVRPNADAFELAFHLQGRVVVPCDRCLEDMELPIETESVLKVRMGEEYGDDGEWVTVPADDGTINVAWHIYEIAALQIPIRHVHADGECAVRYEQQVEETQKSDPRWDELRKILNNNKQ